jgi:hypothetical protein
MAAAPRYGLRPVLDGLDPAARPTSQGRA